MVTTNIAGGGHFFVTAVDPAGPWSEPILVEGPNFDPDLFFDVDGRVWFSWMSMGDGIHQREIDVRTGALSGPVHRIWPGFEDRFCEAPHIYRINGSYYLMVAEGGTHRSHAIVVARGPSPQGPFECCPHNPVLTHRCEVASPIEHTGHGDLVQAPDGSWWVVFLGVRLRHGYFHLGRETFLAPVTWTGDGWPVVNHGRPIEFDMDADLPPSHAWPSEPEREVFAPGALAPHWNFRRNPVPGTWSLTERPGALRLRGTPVSLDEARPLAFIGRRQQHFDCRVATRLEFAPSRAGEEAGLTVFMNEEHHYDLFVTCRDGCNAVVLRKRIGDVVETTGTLDMQAPDCVLAVEADADHYTFLAGPDEERLAPVGTGRTRYLSTNVAGGFTGVYFGVYATGTGAPCGAPVDYHWFEYCPAT
jgi:alpha-N-arabinofuranosidase